MKKRGRPSEQERRETCEGRVGTVIYRLREIGDFGKTIRDVARLSGCSLGAVKKTLYWRGYLDAKRGTEGQVWKVISKLKATGDFLKTDSDIAGMCGLSSREVKQTISWKLYDEAVNHPRPHERLGQALRRRNSVNKITGRVIQFVREAMKRNDLSLSLTHIAGKIACSRSAVQKTQAWRDYRKTRELARLEKRTNDQRIM